MFEVNQAVNLVAPGESLVLACAMLPDAALQMVGDTAIENTRAACEDIDEERTLPHDRSVTLVGRWVGIRERRILLGLEETADPSSLRSLGMTGRWGGE